MRRFCAACLVVIAAGGCECWEDWEDEYQSTLSSPPANVPSARADKPSTPGDMPPVTSGIPCFSKVSDALYRGAQPTAGQFAELKKMGIQTVVSLRYTGSDQDDLEGLGMKYVQFRFNPFQPQEDDVVAFLKVAAEPNNRPVFVHCREGVDRTGMMVAIYRVVVQDWPREKAIAEMESMGSHKTWDKIEQYVRDFDARRIKERLASAEPVRVEVIP